MQSLNKRYLAGLICIPLLALGACSSAESTDEPTTVETEVTETPSDESASESSAAPDESSDEPVDPAGATYGSVEGLRDAAMAAGLKECSEWTKAANPEPEQLGWCGEVNFGEVDNISLGTFSTDAAKEEFLDVQEGICSITSEYDEPCPPTLVGPNWFLSAPQAEELQPALGGELQDG